MATKKAKKDGFEYLSSLDENSQECVVSTRCCLCCYTGKCVRCSCIMKNERCRNCLPSRVGRCKNVVQTDTTAQSAIHLDSSQLFTATQEDSITTLSSLQHSPQQIVGGGWAILMLPRMNLFRISLHFAVHILCQMMIIV